MEPHGRSSFRNWLCGKQFRDIFSTHLVFPFSRSIILTGFTHNDYPGIYQSQDFHYCSFHTDHNIVDYGNAMEVWTCQLSGLAEYAFFCGFDAIHIFAVSKKRATAWQQRRSMFVIGLLNTRTTFSLWVLMTYVWTHRSVRI